MRLTLLGTVIVLLTTPSPARADRDERRLRCAAAAGLAHLAAFTSDATAPVAGLTVSGAHGWTNRLDVGALTSLHAGPAVALRKAALAGQPGKLIVDLLALEVAVELRGRLGVRDARAFARTHPFVAVRVGVLARWLVRPLLVDDATGLAVFAGGDAPAGDLTVRPLVGLTLGVEHRFGRAFFLGATVTTTWAGAAYAAVGVGIEVGWGWY